MVEYIVTRKAGGAEVLRYSAALSAECDAITDYTALSVRLTSL